MKKITITLFWIFALLFNLSGRTGIAINYKFTGQLLAETKIRGKFRVLFQPKMKRITGFVYYQETGKLSPDSDEKDIIVDFIQQVKESYTRQSRSWLRTSLEDENKSIATSRIKIYSKKIKDGVKTTVDLNLSRKLGGKKKYTITFKYFDSKSKKVYTELKSYKTPSAADILSYFIDYEKVINEISKRSIIKKYGIPDEFNIVWQQKGKTIYNITAKIKTKSISLFPDDAFSHRQ